MKDRVQKFLTAAERLAIERKVKEAESSTSGEIVVLAVGASSHYPAAALVGSGTIALAFGVVGMLLLRSENLWLFLLLFAMLFMVSHELLKRIPTLKRLFVNRREMVEEVEEAAIRSFYRHKVHETSQRTGILIYISLFEHSVRVLADSGIDAKVGRTGWTDIVSMITKGILDGRQGEAICQAIDRCGSMLQSHFPRRSDDRNELADVMIIGSPDN
ncbi:MAG: hypothetical protein HGB01_05380 [Chlorobiaceae bacterium]|nr:hypothetical protein [Chlorobiaceae bacterium]